MQKEIESILNKYNTITLEEMDAVRLMNRLDTKYFFKATLILNILERVLPYYRVLEINGKRQFEYFTRYFDTPDFRLYYDHHNGRLNRYKIRQRRYDVTGQEFFEIKFKNNKGQTYKSRIENTRQIIFNEESITFLEKKTPFKAAELNEILANQFIRITLVNNNLTERATIDYRISFINHTNAISYPHVGILEIKQDFTSKKSMLTEVMHELHIQPDSFSKYCTGVVSLYQPQVKINAFKPKLLKMQCF